MKAVARLLLVCLVLGILWSAISSPGAGAQSGPTVTIQDLTIERTDKGFLVRGIVSADGLNPENQVVESDEVDIFADIAISSTVVYPELPTSMYVVWPAGAETPYVKGERLLTKQEVNGIGIAKLVIAHVVLRPYPVWQVYGGLGTWEKQAPASVSKPFEGYIPLEHEGRTVRIRAYLSHVWGGPYANWPAYSFHHFIDFEGKLEGGKTATPGPTETVPPTPSADMDGDGIPDDEDMCRIDVGTKALCGCPEEGPAAGDLVFRYAKPAWGSFYAGYATSEGRKYNFGHVGVYAGDFVADRAYKVRHPLGLIVWRPNASTGTWDVVTLKQGDTVQPGDMVHQAVIEADKGYGGVGISSLGDLKSDHDGTMGSDPDGIRYGAPTGGLSCRQRRLIVQRMAQFAAETDDGSFEYGLLSTNCAWASAEAYTEAGYNTWGELSGYPDATWTPNFVASWMSLQRPGEKRSDASAYLPQKEHRLSISLHSPANIHLYDSTGRHTGPTAGGYECQIPYSEYGQLENDVKFLHLLANASDSYRLRVEGYGDGTFDLQLLSFNYLQGQGGYRVTYEQIASSPQMVAEIALQPGQPAEKAGLALQVDRNGDGQVEQPAQPAIEPFSLGKERPAWLTAITRQVPAVALAGSLALICLIAAAVLLLRPGEGRLQALQKRAHLYRAGRLGPLPPEQLQQAFRAQDRRGAWWSHDPASGQWLLWDGAYWRVAPAPRLGRGALSTGCSLVLLAAGLAALVVLTLLLANREVLEKLLQGSQFAYLAGL